MSDNVSDPGASTMGTDIPFENVSGQTPTIGATRQSKRGIDGRWIPRSITLVRGLGPPGETGPGGLDTTTGRAVPGIRDHSVLLRHPLEFERVVHTVPDYSQFPPLSAQLDDGRYPERGPAYVIDHRVPAAGRHSLPERVLRAMYAG